MRAEERIGIEADGPHHYTANTHEPTGEMRARQRCIMAQGWTLISVPYFHWSRLSQEQRRVILNKVWPQMRLHTSGHD